MSLDEELLDSHDMRRSIDWRNPIMSSDEAVEEDIRNNRMVVRGILKLIIS